MIPVYGLSGIDGVYSQPTATAAQAGGAARVVLLPGNNPDERKAQVLIALRNSDRDAYRLASLYMPYVIDIDPTDGGFMFPTAELSGIAAAGEEKYIAYCNSPYCSEHGKRMVLITPEKYPWNFMWECLENVLWMDIRNLSETDSLDSDVMLFSHLPL